MKTEQKETKSLEENELSKKDWGRCFCGGHCDTILFYFPPDVMVCLDDDTPFYCADCAKDMMRGLN